MCGPSPEVGKYKSGISSILKPCVIHRVPPVLPPPLERASTGTSGYFF